MYDSEELERYLDHIGDLEGSPQHVIDEAKVIGRHALFITPHPMRVHPAAAMNTAKERAAAWIRKRTCRTQ